MTFSMFLDMSLQKILKKTVANVFPNTDFRYYIVHTLHTSRVLGVDLNQVIHIFGSTSSILTHCTHVSELIKLHLMDSCCYPVLSHELKCFNLTEQKCIGRTPSNAPFLKQTQHRL